MRMRIATYLLAGAMISFLVDQSLAESIELPSISAEAGHVFIANRTAQEVIFYLESAKTVRTEHRLGAGNSATYSGDPGDQWFNIYVYTMLNGQKHEVTYGIDAGSRHYIGWREGVLDVFRVPPR